MNLRHGPTVPRDRHPATGGDGGERFGEAGPEVADGQLHEVHVIRLCTQREVISSNSVRSRTGSLATPGTNPNTLQLWATTAQDRRPCVSACVRRTKHRATWTGATRASAEPRRSTRRTVVAGSEAAPIRVSRAISTDRALHPQNRLCTTPCAGASARPPQRCRQAYRSASTTSLWMDLSVPSHFSSASTSHEQRSST